MALVVVHPPGHAGAADFGHPVHRRSGGSDPAQRVFGQFNTFKPIGILLGDKGRRHVTGDENRMIHNRRQERQVVPDPLQLETVQRNAHRLDRRVTGRGPCTQFGDHRIVIHRDLAALIDAGIIAHGGFARGCLSLPFAIHQQGARRHFRGRAIPGQPPDGGQEVAIGIFGVEPIFNRPTGQFHIILRYAERLASGHADHLFNQIDAGDQFGHRVFDLKPCVHFEEVKILLPVHDEFNRARTGIVHRLGQSDGLFSHRAARGFVKEGAGSFLDHFLIAPLDRTFPLAQIDTVAMRIAQDLDFNVPRLGDKFLDEDAIIAKAAGRFVLGALEPLARFIVVPGDPHPLAAAPGAGLDHHRVANLIGDFHRFLGVFDQPHVAGHGADIGFLCDLLGGNLVAHRFDGPHRRADKGDALGLKRLREFRVFRQEPIARMHRLGPGGADGLHHLVDHDIRLVRRGRADQHRFVRHFHMQGLRIGFGIYRNRGDPHFARRLDNAAGNFAPVGDQNFLEHVRSFVWKVSKRKTPQPGVYPVATFCVGSGRAPKGARDVRSAAAGVLLTIEHVGRSAERRTGVDIAVDESRRASAGARSIERLFAKRIAARCQPGTKRAGQRDCPFGSRLWDLDLHVVLPRFFVFLDGSTDGAFHALRKEFLAERPILADLGSFDHKPLPPRKKTSGR